MCVGLYCEFLQTTNTGIIEGNVEVSGNLTLIANSREMATSALFKMLPTDRAFSITSEEDVPTGDHIPVSEHTPEDQKKIETFLAVELQQFRDLRGLSNIAHHKIVITDTRPFKTRYAARYPAMQEIIDGKINELLYKGYIEPSRSPYSSPITPAKR